MTTDILQKILTPSTALAVGDMTPQEKVLLYETMVAHGSSQAFAYDRFFKEGFQQWEITGIDSLKRQYLDLLTNSGENVSGYTDLTAEEQQAGGNFWSLLGAVKHRTRFSQWMAERGMRSAVTVAKRFSSDDWRPFEREGIGQIIREFVAGHDGSSK